MDEWLTNGSGADVPTLSAGTMSQASPVPCSLHLGTGPPSVYREYAPPPGIRDHLVCTWTLEILAGDRPHRQRVLPDGCADIVWIGEALPVVVGPMTRSVLSSSEPGTTVVGLRFRPDVAARVLGVPANELTDRHVPLDLLWRRGLVSEASDRLLEQRTPSGRVTVAQSVLASRLGAIGAPDPIVQQALSVFSASRDERIERLASDVGVSGRHLHRRFIASIGYGPKLFQRILRFQRLLALARAGCCTRLGHVAQVAGYADQAHMTREVGELAGVPPSALLGRVVSALALSDLLAGAEESLTPPARGR